MGKLKIDADHIRSLDPKGTYTIEVPLNISKRQAEQIRKDLLCAAPEAKFIILCSGVKLSDVHFGAP